MCDCAHYFFYNICIVFSNLLVYPAFPRARDIKGITIYRSHADI